VQSSMVEGDNRDLPPNTYTSPELAPLHNAFHQGQYSHVLSLYGSRASTFSSSNTRPALILQYRAQIALSEHDKVLSDPDVRKASSPDYEAVRILAQYAKSRGSEAGDGKARDAASALAQKEGDNAGVQVCCGTVLAGVGAYQESVELLSRHQGSLDA